jgi:hypothetical protein
MARNISMAGTIDEVGFSVAIDVVHENRTGEAVGRDQQEFRMKHPVGVPSPWFAHPYNWGLTCGAGPA